MTSRASSCSRDPAIRKPSPSTQLQSFSTSSANSCKSCGRRNNPSSQVNIIGGEAAYENEFPWAALLLIDDVMRCGGSLINDR